MGFQSHSDTIVNTLSNLNKLQPQKFSKVLGSFIKKYKSKISTDLITKISKIDPEKFKNLVKEHLELKNLIGEILARGKKEASREVVAKNSIKNSGGKAKISLRMDFSNFK